MLAALTTIAQSYSYYNYTTNTGQSSGLSGLMVGYLIGVAIVLVITLISMWKLFVKAGQPGWAALVPIYNWIVLLKIVGRPTWWILLMLASVIPFVGWVVSLVTVAIVYNDLSKSFGQGIGTTLLLLFLPIIGYPMLAFGNATYHGPAALKGTDGAAPPAPHVTA